MCQELPYTFWIQKKKYYIIVAATSWLSGGTGQIFYLPSFAPDPATWEAKAID